jgi:hypothetical protein
MFPEPQIPLIPVVEDLELIAGVVLILRSGQYNTARRVMSAAIEMYPNEPIERVRRCAVAAAESMSDTSAP